MAEILRVGVVDSGFSAHQQGWVEQSAAFVLEDDSLWQAEAMPDQLGHGSQIIDLIHHYAPQARLLVAQVFHGRFTTTAAQVAAAIDWLVAEKVQLISLSLGLRQDRAVLAEAVQRARDAGVILSASSPARGEPVYPSAYPGVFRMTGDARCEDREQWSCLETRYADFGGHVRSLNGPQAGASLGTAAMSGLLCRELVKQPGAGADQLYQALKTGACFYGAERRGGPSDE